MLRAPFDADAAARQFVGSCPPDTPFYKSFEPPKKDRMPATGI
jgi:hypothetical protein